VLLGGVRRRSRAYVVDKLYEAFKVSRSFCGKCQATSSFPLSHQGRFWANVRRERTALSDEFNAVTRATPLVCWPFA